MSYPRLSYSQLTDLLNYAVGLPHRQDGRITRDRIPVSVIQTFTAKHDRYKIEHICEIRLEQLGVMPVRPVKSRGGRPLGQLPDRVRIVIKNHGVML